MCFPLGVRPVCWNVPLTTDCFSLHSSSSWVHSHMHLLFKGTHKSTFKKSLKANGFPPLNMLLILISSFYTFLFEIISHLWKDRQLIYFCNLAKLLKILSYFIKVTCWHGVLKSRLVAFPKNTDILLPICKTVINIRNIKLIYHYLTYRPH